MFFSVFAIYGAYIAVFIGMFYALGFTDLINTSTFTIDTLTGGFSPSAQQFEQYLSLAPKILIISLMIIESVNFSFNYYLFTRKIKKMISKEITLSLVIIAFATIAIYFLTKTAFIDSLFHVISMTPSTGYDYLNIMSLNSTAISIFISLIFIGGCTFSMAGGIRKSRIITFFKSITQAVQVTFVKEHQSEYYLEKKRKKILRRNPSNNLNSTIHSITHHICGAIHDYGSIIYRRNL